MCDRLSHEYGYICNECFDELVQSGPETDVKEFMASDKRRTSTESAYEKFDAEFPNRNG
jgi:hypothetical protein